MEIIRKTGRICYALAMAGVGIHQLFYADFCNFIFPAWPHPFAGYSVLACLLSLFFVGCSLAIIFEKKAKSSALVLGGILLILLFFGQVPYEFIIIPYKKTHLGLWTVALKELALAGGAFCVAGSFADEKSSNFSIHLLEKLIPIGRFLFCTTMISFGISHFLYIASVADMVPAGIGSRYFWAYFAGVALIAGGAAIVLNIYLKLAALLMAAMIFIWFIFLHIPDAISNPLVDHGNEITAALSALAFSGIAMVIATSPAHQSLIYKRLISIQ
jgi:uncharacterized membrane protein YphA (DoxX/SURF4 family)